LPLPSAPADRATLRRAHFGGTLRRAGRTAKRYNSLGVDNIEINLTFNRHDHEEVYFRNGGYETFLNRHLRKEQYTVLVISILTAVSLVFFLATDKNGAIPVILIVLLVLAFYDLYRKVSPGRKWKKGVIKHLDTLGKIKSYKIVLTSTTFKILQDDFQIIENWADFKGFENEPNFICLIANGYYVFPKKAMTEQEFKLLRQFASDKIKNEL
jgi:hypothetical protein